MFYCCVRLFFWGFNAYPMRILRNTDSSKLFTVGPCLERKCNFWNVCLGLTICQGVRRWRGRWHPEIECQEWSDRKGLTAQSATRGHFLKLQRCSICEDWIGKGVRINFFLKYVSIEEKWLPGPCISPMCIAQSRTYNIPREFDWKILLRTLNSSSLGMSTWRCQQDKHIKHVREGRYLFVFCSWYHLNPVVLTRDWAPLWRVWECRQMSSAGQHVNLLIDRI